jgi:hypothetical protein
MIRANLLFVAGLIAASIGSAAAEPPPPLSRELIECREMRIVARQATDLAQPLMQLGLTEALAKGYLTSFRKGIDDCETNVGHQIPGMPRFPSPQDLGRLITDTQNPVRRPARSPTGLIVQGNGLANLGKPAIFNALLEDYHFALVAQCEASALVARIAFSREMFDDLLDKAAFGICAQSGTRGTQNGKRPLVPGLSSTERQCQANVLKALEDLAIDDCPDNSKKHCATKSSHVTVDLAG